MGWILPHNPPREPPLPTPVFQAWQFQKCERIILYWSKNLTLRYFVTGRHRVLLRRVLTLLPPVFWGYNFLSNDFISVQSHVLLGFQNYVKIPGPSYSGLLWLHATLSFQWNSMNESKSTLLKQNTPPDMGQVQRLGQPHFLLSGDEVFQLHIQWIQGISNTKQGFT